MDLHIMYTHPQIIQCSTTNKITLSSCPGLSRQGICRLKVLVSQGLCRSNFYLVFHPEQSEQWGKVQYPVERGHYNKRVLCQEPVAMLRFVVQILHQHKHQGPLPLVPFLFHLPLLCGTFQAMSIVGVLAMVMGLQRHSHHCVANSPHMQRDA